MVRNCLASVRTQPNNDDVIINVRVVQSYSTWIEQMLELSLILMAGLLGSAHCIGMCGPFAIALSGRAKSWRHNLVRQLAFTLGRLFTYAVLGAVAGFGGWRLAQATTQLTYCAAALAIAAGSLLIYQGLRTAGVLPRTFQNAGSICLASDFLRAMLRNPALHGVFIAGLFTGFIPCGLVYGFLALAAAKASLVQGAALMVAFGLGTAPAMLATGYSGSLLPVLVRRHMFQVAAWCVVLTGMISIIRGVGYLPWYGADSTACPFCIR